MRPWRRRLSTARSRRRRRYSRSRPRGCAAGAAHARAVDFVTARRASVKDRWPMPATPTPAIGCVQRAYGPTLGLLPVGDPGCAGSANASVRAQAQVPLGGGAIHRRECISVVGRSGYEVSPAPSRRNSLLSSQYVRRPRPQAPWQDLAHESHRAGPGDSERHAVGGGSSILIEAGSEQKGGSFFLPTENRRARHYSSASR